MFLLAVRDFSQIAKRTKIEQMKIVVFDMFTYVMFPLIYPNSMFVIIMHSQTNIDNYQFMTSGR